MMMADVRIRHAQTCRRHPEVRALARLEGRRPRRVSHGCLYGPLILRGAQGRAPQDDGLWDEYAVARQLSHFPSNKNSTLMVRSGRLAASRTMRPGRLGLPTP